MQDKSQNSESRLPFWCKPHDPTLLLSDPIIFPVLQGLVFCLPEVHHPKPESSCLSYGYIPNGDGPHALQKKRSSK